jgi:hypothetical protein
MAVITTMHTFVKKLCAAGMGCLSFFMIGRTDGLTTNVKLS